MAATAKRQFEGAVKKKNKRKEHDKSLTRSRYARSGKFKLG